jgi:hypothetical protein
MSKKTDGKKEARMIDPNIMPGPMPPPPDQIENTVVFGYYIGDYVQVRHVGFMGIITALGVNQTQGNICLVDSGSEVKWYAEDLLQHVYYHMNPDPPYEPYNKGEGPLDDTTESK